jgi:large subunit ribosomal protein L23
MKPHQIIKRPLLTEKGTQQKETGGEGARTKVMFEVHPDANKIQVRQAVEALFSVKVTGVQTLVVHGKQKRVGRFIGRRPNWKKAIVTLAADNTIDFFEGV